MCYQKIHKCKYCNELFPCSFPDVACATLNDDVDANMCNVCRGKLEAKLSELDYDEVWPDLDKILGE